MKEKYNFEFPLTTIYGFLRAILDLPQVNCTSAEGARVYVAVTASEHGEF